MEHEASRAVEKRRRIRCVAVCAAVSVVVVVLLLAVGLWLRRRESSDLMATFIGKCEKFSGYDCQSMWEAFAGAFVGWDPCNVSVEAYNPLIAAVPFTTACNTMMFWSRTKDVVHDFTAKRECFVTMEDTVLGYTLDNLTWCGKQGSSETFTSGCPGRAQCQKNPVTSFWTRASAAFADAACGNITAMLNGSISTPFSPTSVFGSVEVKRFNSTRIRNLQIVLVTSDNPVANCTNESLKDLQKVLDPGITYSCKEVTESQIQECSSDPHKPCRPCW